MRVTKHPPNRVHEKNDDEDDKWIGNELGEEGTRIIGESLKNNISLTLLDLTSDFSIKSNFQFNGIYTESGW